MKVKQFRYSTDNFTYLLYNKNSAAIIDGGAIENALLFLEGKRINLKYIVNTHGHADHTGGNRALVNRTKADLLDNRILRKNKSLQLGNQSIEVFHTPGHTQDSICFHVDNFLITGDTLFNGTVGNCFSGDLKRFYNSIKMLMAFPDETVIYAGHDYIKDSMVFAKALEPENPDIDTFIENYDPAHVFSTLQEERKINPYLKFNDNKIIAFLEQKGLAVGTEYDRWVSLMGIE
jgi:hydroxyacylglutathione hydrolase